MPLYEITLEQSYVGQQCINRWNYVSSEIPEGDSGAFLALVGMGFTPTDDIEAFGTDTIAYQIRQAQSVGVTFIQAIAKNLYSVTDFYTYAFPPNTNGANDATTGLSPTQAFGFTSDRTRSDIRRAQKRFVGVTEGEVEGGGVFTPTALTALQEWGDAMGEPNIVPASVGVVTYTPYVFGREKYTVEESGKEAYRYYATQSEQEEHIALITTFTPKSQTRTQTSRQYGRGS